MKKFILNLVIVSSMLGWTAEAENKKVSDVTINSSRIMTAEPVIFDKELEADPFNSCSTIVDSIRDESKNGTKHEYLTIEQKLTQPENPRYFIFGLGASYFDNIKTEKWTLDLYGGRFWQLSDGFSLGVSGEILSELKDVFLMDATFSILYYPFYTVIMPFGAISAGPGFFRAYKENQGVLFSGLELGAIVSRVFPFILMTSGRINFLVKAGGNRRFPLPVVYSVRIGTAF